ncbi:MAG: transporter substrate-binding domain-containing protein [Candidatus Tectomicrobia bacterium]
MRRSRVGRGVVWFCLLGLVVNMVLLWERQGASAASETQPQSVLRVGVTPNYPPLLFKQQSMLQGLEVDMARGIGAALGRRIAFVELAWERLIPALKGGQIDVIMSGMSVTEERQQHVRFTQSYLQVGQVAIVRKEKLLEAGSPSLLYRTRSRVGFVAGTTGAAFVKARLRQAQHIPLQSTDEGIAALRAAEIDVFVHDTPTAWRVAGDKANTMLTPTFLPLTEEHLAWAVGKTNDALYQQLNAVLAGWKRSGHLQTLFKRWLTVRLH